MSGRRLVLWRHGRTSWNASQRFQGQSDVPLDEVGVVQAAAAARVLARLERTNGLTLSQLISETESRLPRTLALVAVLQQIDDGGALALAMLRRRGFRVAVVVNQSRDTYLETAAMLAAHRLPTLPLLEEASIPNLSQQWLLQGAIA